MWARLGGVHVIGWVLSILSTAAIAKATQVLIVKRTHRLVPCFPCKDSFDKAEVVGQQVTLMFSNKRRGWREKNRRGLSASEA